MNTVSKKVNKICSVLPSNHYVSDETFFNGHEYAATVQLPQKDCSLLFDDISTFTVVLPSDKKATERLEKLLLLIASEDF